MELLPAKCVCFLHVVTGVLFDGVCVQLNRQSWLQCLLCPDVKDFLDVLLGDPVEADDAAIERWVEFDVLLLSVWIASWSDLKCF